MPMLAPRHTRAPRESVLERERLESTIEEFREAFSRLSEIRLLTGNQVVRLIVGTRVPATTSWYDIARGFYPDDT